MVDKYKVLVAGDIVRDVHLYIAPTDDARLQGAQVTMHRERDGGAALTRGLLVAAANAWLEADAMKRAKPESETTRAERKRAEKALAVARARAAAAIGVATVASRHATDKQPWHALPSYGIWTAHAANRDEKKLVWRVSTQGGHATTPVPIAKPEGLTALGCGADMLVLDDGALAFRHSDEVSLLDLQTPRQVVLKHSTPLCRGDLWARLKERCADRLTVVVKANDLRREEALISQRLSWEQTVIDTLRVLDSHPVARQLKAASHVVVSFGDAGALCLRCDAEKVKDCFLVFRPTEMEGEYATAGLGSVYGYQSCILAAIAYHLAPMPDEAAVPGVFDVHQALERGIRGGLNAQRTLYDAGHGDVTRGDPGFPERAVGSAIAHSLSGLVTIDVPLGVATDADFAANWSILDHQEPGPQGHPYAPMAGLAKLVARYGPAAVSEVPSLSIEPLFSVDRREIESLRAVKRSIEQYESTSDGKRPLSIAVFGPPGAGKSFGVKAIAGKLLPKSELLEFNLSQFDDPQDLVGAFHQVRDAVLRGHTPVVFWDEFDSTEYKWLQYLLAPMQDGAFQEQRIRHPIGKCVFVFAGGTSETLDGFGRVKPPAEGDATAPVAEASTAANTAPSSATPTPNHTAPAKPVPRPALHPKFVLSKGPDFVSRLHAHLNILGPNPRADAPERDRTFPVRRALVMRAALKARPGDTLQLDAGLLHALLTVPKYEHGARSFEKVILAVCPPGAKRLNRSALPAPHVLKADVDGAQLVARLTARDQFKTAVDIEKLAQAVHDNYLTQTKARGDKIDAANDCPYEQLTPDSKTSNRSAAMRIPDILELLDFEVVPAAGQDHAGWQNQLLAAIGLHIERAAKAEHLAWMDDRIANGWRSGATRDTPNRIHDALVDWSQLSRDYQEKDRENIRMIPRLLELAGYQAISRSADTPPPQAG